jgi:hypothetical protein
VLDDLFEIWSFIAGDDLDAAKREPCSLCVFGGYSARRRYSPRLNHPTGALLVGAALSETGLFTDERAGSAAFRIIHRTRNIPPILTAGEKRPSFAKPARFDFLGLGCLE